MQQGFIAIDWGSTNFRAYQVNQYGQVEDQVASTDGVAAIDREAMPGLIGQVVKKWPDQANAIFCCGMVGSTIGWQNIPYLECPISPQQFSKTLPRVAIGEHQVAISPGLMCQSVFGKPDVMRGEEMQYLGYLQEQGEKSTGVVCMPGTHSKWLSVKQGVAEHFFTAMTGDVFAAMSKNGLLKSHLAATVEFSDAFVEGLEYGAAQGNLARKLFSVRSCVVTDQMENNNASSYASGILIGSEVQDALQNYPSLLGGTPITLIGSAELCQLYQQALTHFGQSSTFLNARDACIKGFTLIHQMREG